MNHRGAIKVYTELNRGTTFKVLLPAVGEAMETSSSQLETPPLKGSGLVLVVDDEAAVRIVARSILERAGFSVLEAVDGDDALSKFREHRSEIRAVMLDLTMPRLDGDACFREMLRLSGDVRVLMTSGYNEQDVATRFAGNGMQGFLQKPFTQQQLLSALRSTLK